MGFFTTKSIDRKIPKVIRLQTVTLPADSVNGHIATCRVMQRKVEDWKKSDVYKWLSVLEMSKYEDAFKNISGKARQNRTSTHCCTATKRSRIYVVALKLGMLNSAQPVCLQRVLQLSAADVYRFAENKQDADVLLESVQSLRETGV